MAKEAFEKIMEGLEEAVAIAEGRADPSTYRLHVPPMVDVKAIRRRLGLTQAPFAAKFGLSSGSIRDWEQGRRTPDPAARVLLRIIAREPEAVERALMET